MKRVLITCLIAAFAAAAQDVPVPSDVRILPINQWDAVKAHLGLSDSQMRSLEDILRSRQQAEQARYQQIAEKERALYTLLESGSTDAAQIGRLMIEINQMRKQGVGPADAYRKSALAVLNQEQLGKLAALDTALKLNPAAHEAVRLNLLDYPSYPMPTGPRILPVDAEPARQP